MGRRFVCLLILPGRPLTMRLTRQQSLNRAFQFARVRSEGTSIAGRLVVLSLFPLPDRNEASRFGIICTKKVASRAVMRNKLKRRVREIIREHGSPFQKGYHVVCVLRWRSLEADYRNLTKDWIKTSTKLLRQFDRLANENSNTPLP